MTDRCPEGCRNCAIYGGATVAEDDVVAAVATAYGDGLRDGDAAALAYQRGHADGETAGRISERQAIAEAASWALKHFYHADRANAVMHTAAVRFSPITFRLAEALQELDPTDEVVAEVLSHKGRYEEDTGR